MKSMVYWPEELERKTIHALPSKWGPYLFFLKYKEYPENSFPPWAQPETANFTLLFFILISIYLFILLLLLLLNIKTMIVPVFLSMAQGHRKEWVSVQATGRHLISKGELRKGADFPTRHVIPVKKEDSLGGLLSVSSKTPERLQAFQLLIFLPSWSDKRPHCSQTASGAVKGRSCFGALFSASKVPISMN